jgi:hypothetical protein
MKEKIIFLIFVCFVDSGFRQSNRATVSIREEAFYIDGKPTYEGRYWKTKKIEGLLINSRMVQGTFDDLNPQTRQRFIYPDTRKWDAGRNNREFVEAMDEWHRYGLNSFTLNLQGGSPVGYGNQDNWINSAYFEDGTLRPEFMGRLEKILSRAEELNMVVILGLFYFGQDQHLRDEKAVMAGVKNVMEWLFRKGYKNVLIEINNECDIPQYDHDILKPPRVHELINLVKGYEQNGYRYLVSTSFAGNTIPTSDVVKASDFILLHGNGIDFENLQRLIDNTRKVDGYRPMPVIVNEDDHFDFDQDKNNFVTAIGRYVSWGYFDYRKGGEDFEVGYQTVPVDWGIHSERKKQFFNKVKEITGGLRK